MEGIVLKNGLIEVEGKSYAISKTQKNHILQEGEKVDVTIDTEYPEACDSFCDGDETCMICLYNNNVVFLNKQ